MNGLRTPLIFLVAALLLVIVAESTKRKPIDWSDGFGSGQTKPFGGLILHDRLAGHFGVESVGEIDETFWEMEQGRDLPEEGTIVIVTDRVAFDRLETETMLEWVAGGRHLLIAARKFDGFFGDSLGIRTEGDPGWMPTIDGTSELARGKVELVNPQFSDPIAEIPTRFRLTFLSTFDEDLAVVLERMLSASQTEAEEEEDDEPTGTTDAEEEIAEEDDPAAELGDRVTTIRMTIGEGTIVLSSVPEGFSNIALMTDDGRRRTDRLLSYLPEGEVYWSSYHKPVAASTGGGRGESIFSYIRSRPLLNQAWILFLAGLAAFVIFALRRRQRIIPVVTPPRNETLDFVETVGQLYHDRGTPGGVAEKRIASLLEYVRTRLDLATNRLDDLFARRLADRSGLPYEKTAPLVAALRRPSDGMTAADLIELDRMIEDFYEETRR